MCTLLILTMVFGAAVPTTRPAVEVKPAALILAQPTELERQSFAIHCRTGGLQIESAAASDPAIGVEHREYVPGRTFIVTAAIPAGYHTPVTGEKPYIEVKTNRDPTPLRVSVETRVPVEPRNPQWLSQAQLLIGHPLPRFSLGRLDAEGKVDLEPEPGAVSAVVFSINWCAHCDDLMPTITQVVNEYAERGVRVYWVAGDFGDKSRVREAAERWSMRQSDHEEEKGDITDS